MVLVATSPTLPTKFPSPEVVFSAPDVNPEANPDIPDLKLSAALAVFAKLDKLFNPSVIPPVVLLVKLFANPEAKLFAPDVKLLAKLSAPDVKLFANPEAKLSAPDVKLLAAVFNPLAKLPNPVPVFVVVKLFIPEA